MDQKKTPDTENIPQDIGCGCCAGSCLGSLFNFAVFVLMLIQARRHHLPDPYNDMDVLFTIMTGIIIGGVIGAIVNPLFRRYILRKRQQ